MVWWMLAISTLLSLVVIGVSIVILRSTRDFFQAQLEAERKDHQEQRATWTLERERLMNRVMTKEWESYAQMQTMMQMGGTPSQSEPAVGLSDETEAELWAKAHSEIGEIFVELPDPNDVQGLGLSG